MEGTVTEEKGGSRPCGPSAATRGPWTVDRGRAPGPAAEATATAACLTRAYDRREQGREEQSSRDDRGRRGRRSRRSHRDGRRLQRLQQAAAATGAPSKQAATKTRLPGLVTDDQARRRRSMNLGASYLESQNNEPTTRPDGSQVAGTAHDSNFVQGAALTRRPACRPARQPTSQSANQPPGYMRRMRARERPGQTGRQEAGKIVAHRRGRTKPGRNTGCWGAREDGPRRFPTTGTRCWRGDLGGLSSGGPGAGCCDLAAVVVSSGRGEAVTRQTGWMEVAVWDWRGSTAAGRSEAAPRIAGWPGRRSGRARRGWRREAIERGGVTHASMLGVWRMCMRVRARACVCMCLCGSDARASV